VLNLKKNKKSLHSVYPFGGAFPGRNFSSSEYRFGFQGQESDSEIKGAGNSINYKYRMHDPRTGRFFAVDPLAPDYPWNSPYAFSENQVINAVELEGLEKFEISGSGSYNSSNLLTGSSTSASYAFTGSVYGPYKDGSAAYNAARSGSAPVHDFEAAFTTTTSNRTFGSSISWQTSDGSFSAATYNLNGPNIGSSIERVGDVSALPTSSNSYSRRSFGYVGTQGSGLCESTDVGGALVGNFVQAPMQQGLEYLGMGEKSAYWTSASVTMVASALVARRVSAKPAVNTKVTPEINPECFIKMKGKQGYINIESGEIFKKSFTSHGNKGNTGTQWKVYPKGTKDFSKKAGKRTTLDSDGNIIGM
jgi:RHS repeat-associated protein